jgi:hypothetical protein
MTFTTSNSSTKTTTATTGSSAIVIPINLATTPAPNMFEKFKEAWLLQVMADGGIPASAKSVATVIAAHMNRKRPRHDAFPGFARLTRLTAMSRRNVIRATKHLERAGHVEVRRAKAGKSGKKNNANVYFPIRKGCVSTASDPDCHHVVTRLSPRSDMAVTTPSDTAVTLTSKSEPPSEPPSEPLSLRPQNSFGAVFDTIFGNQKEVAEERKERDRREEVKSDRHCSDSPFKPRARRLCYELVRQYAPKQLGLVARVFRAGADPAEVLAAVEESIVLGGAFGEALASCIPAEHRA